MEYFFFYILLLPTDAALQFVLETNPLIQFLKKLVLIPFCDKFIRNKYENRYHLK